MAFDVVVRVRGSRLECVEVRKLRHESRVLHLEVEPQIRLVASVEVERVVPADSVEVHGKVVVQRLLEDVAHHSLCGLKNFLAVREAHLHVYLRELRLSVSACVLVAVAAGNLEILVESRYHQKLLVELRRLRKRVEFPRMDAAWDEIVARAFRCGLDERRCLDFEEAL